MYNNMWAQSSSHGIKKKNVGLSKDKAVTVYLKIHRTSNLTEEYWKISIVEASVSSWISEYKPYREQTCFTVSVFIWPNTKCTDALQMLNITVAL